MSKISRVHEMGLETGSAADPSPGSAAGPNPVRQSLVLNFIVFSTIAIHAPSLIHTDNSLTRTRRWWLQNVADCEQAARLGTIIQRVATVPLDISLSMKIKIWFAQSVWRIVHTAQVQTGARRARMVIS